MSHANHLEQLVAEWYEFQGYFVRRNVRVGNRHEELDVVAFSPTKKHLVHVEASCDSNSIEKRILNYTRKFQAGRKYIPGLFPGLRVPKKIEQIGLFRKGANRGRIAGGKMVLVKELIKEILDGLQPDRINSCRVPESYPLLRTLQLVIDNQ
ncbi:MAG: hypothetical protein NTV08_10145 [Verrucomicrobia bacterium]|nr:hypothetical protein [Verrucomicrobiota bacterium]